MGATIDCLSIYGKASQLGVSFSPEEDRVFSCLEMDCAEEFRFWFASPRCQLIVQALSANRANNSDASSQPSPMVRKVVETFKKKGWESAENYKDD